jgi:hypothetical protein
MNNFILEKNNFISKNDADDILNKIVNAHLPFEKNSYNIHGENYEYHNLEKEPDFSLVIKNYENKITRELRNYFSDYDVSTFAQNFLSASVLYLKGGSIIPKHTDDQYDRGVIRTVAILLYLNTPKSGGELAFPLQKILINPEAGKLVIFPSTYTHPHMVMPTGGCDRYALRFNYGMIL